MWSNENHRETEGDISTWTNMNPWVNSRSGNTNATATDRSPQSPMNHSQGYSSVPMRQPSRSWDLHTHQQFHPGMNSRWGSNSNWSANGGATPPTASLNSPVKQPVDLWGPPQQQQQQQQPQWNASMINGSEPKRNPAVLHRSMTGPTQTWGHKVDQQTPWDMGNTTEQQQPPANYDWHNGQKWSAQGYAWRQSENSPEWVAGSNNQQAAEIGWNGGSPPEEAKNEATSPNSWPKEAAEPAHNGSGNTDMVWQDPNPKMKQKKIARDTGTAIWGDPESQKKVTEIRHWKSPEAAAYSNAAANDWTTADQTYQNPNGWGEPASHQSKMWSIATAWSDAQDDSVPDMIIPKLSHALGTNTLLETLKSAVSTNPQLANQISEQFQGAVNRNWVNHIIYTAQIIPAHATLHQLIKRMYKKEDEVLKLRHHAPSQATVLCKERILSEIQQTKNELAEIQRAICGAAPPPTTLASTPADGQSRLRQWKRNGNAMANKHPCDNGRNMMANSLPADSGMNSMSSDAMKMNSLINSTHHLSINPDSLNNSWKQGSLEWSPPATRDDRRKSSEESGMSATSQMHAEIQEFIPGKRWEYRDPNKIAEDPNATPGSCKPHPLLSSAALRLHMNNGSNDTAAQNMVNHNQNGWNSRIPPPQAQKQQMPITSPMMSPNNEQPAINENIIFLPHCWLLFQLDESITEIQFQQLCHHVGHMMNFCMIGPTIACVKFNTNNVDHIIHRIRSEYNLKQFRIVSDEEFNNKMLKHTRYLQVNGYESMPPMMPHQTPPWNFVQPIYHNDPTCQY